MPDTSGAAQEREQLRGAYEAGYSRGHNDTVESVVVSPELAADEYLALLGAAPQGEPGRVLVNGAWETLCRCATADRTGPFRDRCARCGGLLAVFTSAGAGAAPSGDGVRSRVDGIRFRNPQSRYAEGWNAALDEVVAVLPAATRESDSDWLRRYEQLKVDYVCKATVAASPLSGKDAENDATTAERALDAHVTVASRAAPAERGERARIEVWRGDTGWFYYAVDSQGFMQGCYPDPASAEAHVQRLAAAPREQERVVESVQSSTMLVTGAAAAPVAREQPEPIEASWVSMAGAHKRLDPNAPLGTPEPEHPAVRALMHDPTPDEWGALTANVLRNWPEERMRRLRDFLDARLPRTPEPPAPANYNPTIGREKPDSSEPPAPGETLPRAKPRIPDSLLQPEEPVCRICEPERIQLCADHWDDPAAPTGEAARLALRLESMNRMYSEFLFANGGDERCDHPILRKHTDYLDAAARLLRGERTSEEA